MGLVGKDGGSEVREGMVGMLVLESWGRGTGACGSNISLPSQGPWGLPAWGVKAMM